MPTSIRISPPSPRHTGYRGVPMLALGFRPFYLLAAAFGVIAIAAWVAIYLGWWQPASRPWLGAMVWHAHEMVFGFAAAVVVGFLFTAGKNWTGLQTPQGAWLGALAGVWLAARVLMWSGPAWLAIALDLVFLPLCAASFYRLLRRARNHRNIGLALALGVLGALNLAFHVAAGRGDLGGALRVTEAATGLITLFITVIGGRVIPMFTANAVPGVTIRRSAWVERVVVAATLLAIVAHSAHAPAFVVVPLALAAAATHAVRLAGWDPLRTLRTPLVAILHVAYAFLPLGFALLAGAAVGWLDGSTALHALTVGAIACAILAMITRTALGHTGRRLATGRIEHLAYASIVLAALVRVLGPLALPAFKPYAIGAAGMLWVAAFVLYLVKYAPYLSRARVDGKEG
ncbi:NnrS family protein [Cupriavidus sp. Marseille-Q8015]|nr:MAG: short-chain dehydrogenase [Cupriavidus sp.]